MVTACCNLVKKGGSGGRVAHKYHDILPQTHAKQPHRPFINLSKIQDHVKKQLMQVSQIGIDGHNKLHKMHDTVQQ